MSWELDRDLFEAVLLAAGLEPRDDGCGGTPTRASCRLCGRRSVPGHMHDHDVCQSCAERHLDVVH